MNPTDITNVDSDGNVTLSTTITTTLSDLEKQETQAQEEVDALTHIIATQQSRLTTAQASLAAIQATIAAARACIAA